MKANSQTGGTADGASAAESVAVLCRFSREELDAMREETGAQADATAVACFARKALRRRAS